MYPLEKFAGFDLGTSGHAERVGVFSLSIYGLVIFPKALRHIDEVVSDLFDRLDKRVTHVPMILAETFISLSAFRRAGEGSFIGCAQHLLAWFHSHFWKVEKVFYQVFFKNNSPLKEFVATPRRDDISEEKWMAILQSLHDKELEWKAHWMIPDEICIDVETSTGSLYSGYGELLDMPLYLSSELGKKIEQLEEEKMQLGLDVGVQNLEAEKIRKEKNKAEEDLDNLKTDYKKVCLSIRTVRYHSHDFAIELKASLNKIEKLKRMIEELKTILQNCELRVELLETNNEHWKEQFQRSQGLIRDRDHIMGEAVTQVREVADHLQTLTVQADMLSLKYESESDRGRELAWLLKKVKALSIRERPYMVPVTIKPQKHQAGTSAPVNYPTDSGSNLRDNPTNPDVPNLDDMVEIDRAKVELPKQLEDRCKWLEEKFRAMENVDYLYGVDAKELSLVPDLDSLIRSAAKWYNHHVTDMTPDRITLQNMEKKQSESFRQYAQRWREVATQV
ncbi:coiled-coil domain-containing protein 102A-like protein [Gossypium australe]|uniref:Coiled-coil domain-containing protein 102A-like protein n=1 Tax=Gossypium australe TaxID=47621 RepID=A0A5B6X4H3_9ROSI|nr:coiled-coil domain-containing protein 102A-like protein [Gossypium australe]